MRKRVDLKPMSSAEYKVWLPGQLRAYADSKVRSGNWAPEEANTLARETTATLLPQGERTPNHHFYNILDADTQTKVGMCWIHTIQKGSIQEAFVYNIEIEPEFQSQGYGTSAFSELERMLKEKRVSRLSLHVFGFNQGARQLYERLGFQVTNINMSKDI